MLPVLEHFAKQNHQLSDMMVAVIKAGLGFPTRRKREEMQNIANFETLAPSGLNQDFGFLWLTLVPCMPTAFFRVRAVLHKQI